MTGHARTIGTGGLSEDLDGPRRHPGVVHHRHWLAVDALAYAVVNLLLVAGWIVTEAAFFWPVFPLFGWGIALVVHTWVVLVVAPTRT
ncbi:2TM domain-containing protein [Pedococcus sp. KACC 23699]|uniref:2TM domain-containing protein n=1 Tax=Pedococcus sp. KACC 23699 TaxID=3149228 RepID=A0AAU7JSL5_9MICO